nr:glycoside hydrolase family 97 protein [uncultured Emticicia sp.]
MKFIYTAFFSWLLSYTLVAQSWQVTSPDAKIRATLQRIVPDGTLKYNVEYLENNQIQTIIEPSNLGITRIDQSFINGLTFEGSSTATIDENYTMLIGKQLQLRNNANEITLNFHNSNNSKFQVTFRAYNDGVAVRYRFPETSNNTYYVTEDRTTFQIPVNNSKTWIQGYDNFRPVYEKLYENGLNLNQAINQFNGLAFPALFQTPNAWVLLTEADLDEKFYASHLSSYFGNGTFSIAAPSPYDGNSYAAYAGSTLPWTMPWRVIMIGKQLNNVVESNFVSHVSKASQITNTTWIQPGISTWSWWSDLGSPTNFIKLKSFIDLAAELNLPYSLIDANWNQMGNGGDINALITYANSKNVKLWLWYNSGGPSNDQTEQPRDLMHIQSARREEFARIHALGVKGVKIDYFQSDKQELIKLYIDILKDAAEYELMVNFHGNVIPKGWSRTYPNLVAMEAVKGSEAYIFDGSFLPNAPRHHTILPFTRNVIGPMDYTPTIIGWGRGVEHLTTDVHEIALLNTFESGLTHLVDMVASYSNLPTLAKSIISNFPTTWDETRLVEGFPGTHVVMARRKGENWYISGINGENQERNISLPLSFIATGDYTSQLLSDGANPRDIVTSEINYQVQANNTISLNMRPYGGFMMVLKRTACQTTHTLTSQITTNQKYEASTTIQATNIVSSSANVTYDAAKSILLTAGFQTQQGAVFKAYIDGCGNQ